MFASTTYNAGVFVTMEALINDLVAHNIQNRTVGIIENGTWAGDERRSYPGTALEKCKNMTFVGDKVSIKSSVKPETLESIFALAGRGLPPRCRSMRLRCTHGGERRRFRAVPVFPTGSLS